jgi:2-polyprenyl-3-methyl-5-hydroxy-6-metoxy-1,4-benzoquinol methylase
MVAGQNLHGPRPIPWPAPCWDDQTPARPVSTYQLNKLNPIRPCGFVERFVNSSWAVTASPKTRARERIEHEISGRNRRDCPIVSGEKAETCPLCAADVSVIADTHPGYQDKYLYRILECQYCDLQFTDPMAVPPRLYESIYANADRLPGYSRYFRYHDMVKASRKPLDWLAAQDSSYWFIRAELAALPPRARILEIGSGLGYLTYAIHTAGYSITGIDISNDAVNKARSTFGDLYLCKDLGLLAAEEPDSFDAVIMTEVIEHVPEPQMFLGAAASLLKTNGQIILTTPNKSDSLPGTCWNTENPPVHLWWFSETTMRRLAQMNGLSIRLGDFTAMYGGSRHPLATTPEYPAWLDEAGRVTEAATRLLTTGDDWDIKMARLKRCFGRFWPLFLRVRRVKQVYPTLLQRDPRMGIVLTKKLATRS